MVVSPDKVGEAEGGGEEGGLGDERRWVRCFEKWVCYVGERWRNVGLSLYALGWFLFTGGVVLRVYKNVFCMNPRV